MTASKPHTESQDFVFKETVENNVSRPLTFFGAQVSLFQQPRCARDGRVG